MAGIKIKTPDELKLMRSACAVAAEILDDIGAFIKPGVTTQQVDDFAAGQIKARGGKSAFLGYRKYPRHVCISVNDEVVHGLGGERELRFGDIVSVDVGVTYKGFIGDNARTFAAGGCGVQAQRLLDVTEQALYLGIAAAKPANRVTDISRAIQDFVESNGFSVVREFVGHGVGRAMHEEPQVPNFVDRKMNEKLRPGMTIAIEPMVNAGQPGVKILKDGWTVVTQDGSLSAHFEHTVLITDGEPEILTWPEKKPSRLKAA
ncbi:MAG TPA: type I methionyl aminopeptidase [Candidatus Baltobacteraceae bacterium]|nr:type I methionyl aminopeptidase [Candidatus Baltobacteraceae bacterium]